MNLPPKPGDMVLPPHNLIATVIKVEGKTVHVEWRDPAYGFVKHQDKFHYRQLRRIHYVERKK